MTNSNKKNPRNISFIPNINPYASGSVLAKFGNTNVHITVILEDKVPHFLRGKGKGWLTAEYSMLPGSTQERTQRERKGIKGRSQEIQRLIGRSLRQAIDLDQIGEKTFLIDCDVLVADGGTRTASISGAYVALALAVRKLLKNGKLKKDPLNTPIGAISVGIDASGEVISDLNYQEDSSSQTDMNIVMTNEYKFIEIQGTAEKSPFSHEELTSIIDCAKESLRYVFEEQEKCLKTVID